MQIFSALADPTRQRIVELVAVTERSAGEIAERFEVSQPAISQHLKILREAGVIQRRTDAQRRLYRLNPAALIEVDRWLMRIRRFWATRLDALERELAPNPKETR